MKLDKYVAYKGRRLFKIWGRAYIVPKLATNAKRITWNVNIPETPGGDMWNRGGGFSFDCLENKGNAVHWLWQSMGDGTIKIKAEVYDEGVFMPLLTKRGHKKEAIVKEGEDFEIDISIIEGQGYRIEVGEMSVFAELNHRDRSLKTLAPKLAGKARQRIELFYNITIHK